jgi:hypothetical protein
VQLVPLVQVAQLALQLMQSFEGFR